jgi:hypothetical protein
VSKQGTLTAVHKLLELTQKLPRAFHRNEHSNGDLEQLGKTPHAETREKRV